MLGEQIAVGFSIFLLVETEVKFTHKIMYLLINASPPKPLDEKNSKFVYE